MSNNVVHVESRAIVRHDQSVMRTQRIEGKRVRLRGGETIRDIRLPNRKPTQNCYQCTSKPQPKGTHNARAHLRGRESVCVSVSVCVYLGVAGGQDEKTWMSLRELMFDESPFF